jgi:putative ABC transport system ATP-binding protein
MYGMIDFVRLESLRKTYDDPVTALDGAAIGPLDLHSARDVLALLRSVVDQYGRTVLMVIHAPVAASCAGTLASRGSMS